MIIDGVDYSDESSSGGGSGGGLTSSQVQALIDNAGHANQSDVQPLLDKERHVNVAPNGLAAYDPIRSFNISPTTAITWFKIAELRIPGAFMGFAIKYMLMSRLVQSEGVIRLIANNPASAIQMLRSKTGTGSAQLVLMREDADPTNYHLLVKMGSFIRHVAMSQEVFKSRLDEPNLTWNVDYQTTTSSGDSSTSQTVTDYTGFTQIASVVL